MAQIKHKVTEIHKEKVFCNECDNTSKNHMFVRYGETDICLVCYNKKLCIMCKNLAMYYSEKTGEKLCEICNNINNGIRRNDYHKEACFIPIKND